MKDIHGCESRGTVFTILIGLVNLLILIKKRNKCTNDNKNTISHDTEKEKCKAYFGYHFGNV
jgi:hypothetical protein